MIMSTLPSAFRKIPLKLLILILSVSLLFQANSQSQNYDQEKEKSILLKLKNEWRNPTSINSWNPSTSHCNWTGIICDNDGFVTRIKLIYMNIAGEIPPFICDLKNLTEINLYSNFILGEFPTTLYNCSKLEILDLSRNYFRGRIPDDIDRISSLRLLNLGSNNFSSNIPASIGRFPFLQTLELHKNRFDGYFPTEIGNLTNLEVLQLGYNKFTPSRIPSEFGKLKKLEQLRMRETNLIGEIPETIGNLSNLVILDLGMNNLNGTIPRNLFMLKTLTNVSLSNNTLSGEIPSEIERSSLNKMDLSYNMLSGKIPESVGKWQHLAYLLMSYNQFTGQIPVSFGQITNLQVLDASNNMFTGKIPSELTSLANLSTLSLHGNQLSGEIPSEIISWRSLRILTLSKNQISGELPVELCLLPVLDFLDLSENHISGEIPSEIENLKLRFLNLSSNKLTGKIPAAFDNPKFKRSFLNNSGLSARKSSELPPILLALIVVVIAGATILVSIIMIKIFCKRKPKQDESTGVMTSFQELHFTKSNILSNLTENNQIGSGGSGKVYRVPIDHLGNFVAVKKIWSERKLDQKLEKQFQAEVQILGTIRHYNIVKLLCCISSKNSKLLVYDYMENGSLSQWLHEYNRGLSNSNNHKFLDWPKRLQIAVGVAQGLSYMHHNCSPPIIHRDVKSSNILLDSNFKARIADFGLARSLTKQGEPNSASVIAGSFGYIAPEYAHTRKVNEKIDVYSFGVVLLELVTGKEASKGDEDRNLAEWAWSCFQQVNSVDILMDERVKEEFYLEEMRMVFKLGMICTNTLPSSRPSMKEALQILLRHGPLHPT